MKSSVSTPVLSSSASNMTSEAPSRVEFASDRENKVGKRKLRSGHGGRKKVELYSTDYWKVWKSKINIGPQIDPIAEKAKAAAVEKERADRREEINARGYVYHHPNKGWIKGGGGDKKSDEPDSLLAQALAGGHKVPLDYRPDNDHPNMIDLVGHNGDGVTGPFRSSYRGGPRKPRSTIFGRSARNDFALGTGSAKVDAPLRTLPSTFGSRPMASSRMRTAQSVHFGSSIQHGSPVGKGGGSGPGVVPIPKSKIGGLFSGGGGVKTESLLPKGLGEPGPAGLYNESQVKPRIIVPRLGRTDRWATAAYAEKSNRGAGADRIYTLPSYIGGVTTESPHVYRSRAFDMGITLEQRIQESEQAETQSMPRGSITLNYSPTKSKSRTAIRTDAKDSDLDPNLTPFAGFGFGCSMEEHVKYGCCLDGKCSERSTWEATNSLRLNGKRDRNHKIKMKELRKRCHANSWESGLSFNGSQSNSKKGGRGRSRDSSRSITNISSDSKLREKSIRRRQIRQIQRRRGEDVSTPGTMTSSRGQTATSKASVSSSLASARNKEGAVWGETPLHLATRSGEADKLKHLLKGVQVWSPRQNCMVRKGRDVNARDSQMRTPLHTACYDGNVPMVRVILDAVPKADLDAQDYEGNTPLHLAMIKGHDYVARLLIQAGCDPDIQNNNGKMPYNLATSHRSYQFSKEASMLVDIRMKKVLTQQKLEKIRERQYRETHVNQKVDLGVNLSTLKVTGKSTYASVVRLLKEAAAKKRRLFGSVINDLSSMFRAADIDGDGHITTDELAAAFRRLDLGFQDEQIAIMMRDMDKDGNNTIERDEFFDAIEKFSKM